MRFKGLAGLSDGVLRLLEQNVGLTYGEVREALDIVLKVLHEGGVIQMTHGRIFPMPFLGAIKK